MVTLKEIAQHCGVSVTTVSNIVNNSPKKVRDETRKKVMEAIEELGYHPNYFAQGLRRQRTQTIGVITEDLEQFTTPEIVEGIMKYCEEKSIVFFCRILGCIQDGKINGTMMKR